MGFHIDEAKVAWESYSILKTGKDDLGNMFALHYNSFGDYRPTGIFYATIPSLIILGKTNFAVRFPSAFFGALTVIPVYLISLLITKNKKVSLFASFLLAIIPWDIATSRATSEVIISCFLILSSLSLLPKKTKLSFFLLGLSFLFYHSARVMGPILMFTWIIYLISHKKLKFSKNIFFGFLITSFIAFTLLFSKTGLSRYNQVKLAAPTFRNIVIQYSSYFDPNFLIGDIAKPFRYTSSNVGIVSIPILILFILGIYIIFRTNKNKILLLFFALGPIPASLTLEDSPNLHRAFFMLPFLVIIAALGLNYLFEKHKIFFKILLFCCLWSFVGFLISYFNTSNNFAYNYRDPNIQELVSYIKQNQNNYSKIYVTNSPDSPYAWYGFFNNINPLQFNINYQNNIDGKWEYENIIWTTNKCPAADAFDAAKNNINLQKIMVIDNGDCFSDLQKTNPKVKIIKEFKNNKTVNYRVWEYSKI